MHDVIGLLQMSTTPLRFTTQYKRQRGIADKQTFMGLSPLPQTPAHFFVRFFSVFRCSCVCMWWRWGELHLVQSYRGYVAQQPPDTQRSGRSDHIPDAVMQHQSADVSDLQ